MTVTVTVYAPGLTVEVLDRAVEPPPPPTPVGSPDGTRIPPAAQIVAPDGVVWTLTGKVYRNGVERPWGTCLALKLWSGAMHVQGDSGTWYSLNADGDIAQQLSGEPGGAAPAPSPAPVPSPGPSPAPAPAPSVPDPPPLPPLPEPAPDTHDFGTLQPGFARLVGSWLEDPTLTEATEANVQAPGQRTDWGSMCYSKRHDALFLHGGHHGLHLSTAPRKLQPQYGLYRNIAPTVPVPMMTPENSDATKGRWISHNAPWARHPFQSIVTMGDHVGCLLGQNSHNPVNGQVIPGGDGKPYFWHLSNSDPLTACEYVLSAAGWHSHWMGAVGVGERYVVACYVPESSWLQCWVYDHVTKTKRQVPMAIDTIGWPGSVCVCFDGTYFYAVGPTGRVFKLAVDLAAATGTSEMLSEGWAPLSDISDARVDYDAANHALGGCLANGKYRRFNLATRQWSEVTLQVEAGSTGTPHQSFWCSAFDAKRRVYFAANNTGQLWAVRPPPFP